MRDRLRPLPLVLLLSTTLAAQAVPTGLVDEAVVGGLPECTSFTFLPDGRVLLLARHTGDVIVHVPGVGHAVVGTVAGVRSGGYEQGAMAITVGPDLQIWPYLYCYYTHVSGDLRITRYTLTGDVTAAPGSLALGMAARYDVLTGIPDAHEYHNGGKLHFGPDGHLYASVGDDNDACQAQVPGTLSGVILRLDVAAVRGAAGAGPPPVSAITPAVHPFSGEPDALVWALGLRNPYSFHVDPVTGRLYVADVGELSWEEIDELTGPGVNLGWPEHEGNVPYSAACGPSPVPGPRTFPIAVWQHVPPSPNVIVSFGGRYRNRGGVFDFGPVYEGDVLFTEFFSGEVRRIEWNGSTWGNAVPVPGQPSGDLWAWVHVQPTEANVGPDGALYYLRRVQVPGTGITGELRRIRPAAVTPRLSVAAGDGQIGTPGRPLAAPLAVRATDGAGQPAAGVPVTFALTAGAGSLSPQPVTTDAAGLATTSFMPGSSPRSDPLVTATAPGFQAAHFPVRWRGLHVVHAPSDGTLVLYVKHSQPSAPITVAADVPPPLPWAAFPFGEIWTSIGQPAPTAFLLDGLGLAGPPDPGMVTDASGVWTLAVAGLPSLNGLPLVFQAYGLDAQLHPAPAAFFVSNPCRTVLP